MKYLSVLKCLLIVLAPLLLVLLPSIGLAQEAIGNDLKSMQSVLDEVYAQMIPLCSRLISVGRGIAGFAALWYMASRVWRHIAAAESIDFYPLLRPFALGLAVLLFPSVLALMNGVLQPTVTATSAMVEGSDKAIAVLLKQKEDAIKKSDPWQMYVGEDGRGSREKWYKYAHPDDEDGEGIFESVGNDVKFAMAKAAYSFKNSIKQWMSEVLQVLYAAASLCINTIRTFYLIVLAILGPLVFGFAVFDGFQHTLTIWIARYVNIFLWLPVANIFGSIIGKIQENMIRLDIGQISTTGDTFFSPTDTGYLLFLIIGIIGYFTVPNVANYIVHAGGGNALLQKVNTLVAGSSSYVMRTGGAEGGMMSDVNGDASGRIGRSMASFAGSSPYFNGEGTDARRSGYQHDKLKGG